MQEFLTNQGIILTRVLQTIVIIVIAIILLKLAMSTRNRIEKHLLRGDKLPKNADQIRTIMTMGDYVIRIIIISIAIMMILLVFGINLAPLLATVGVASLAISLGAQTLFKDYVGGIIILIEGAFYIGDMITIGTTTGIIEKITLRATYIRNSDDMMIVIPNGDIRTYTKLKPDNV
jgi:small-conductance mechanosensitive channel